MYISVQGSGEGGVGMTAVTNHLTAQKDRGFGHNNTQRRHEGCWYWLVLSM